MIWVWFRWKPLNYEDIKELLQNAKILEVDVEDDALILFLRKEGRNYIVKIEASYDNELEEGEINVYARV